MIPNGTTAQRPSHLIREWRFNSETVWRYGAAIVGSLGGVIDVNQDTFISAENSATNNNDELSTEGVQRMIIANSKIGYIGIGQ